MEFVEGQRVSVYDDFTKRKLGEGTVRGREHALSYSVIVEIDYAPAGTSRLRYFRPDQLSSQPTTEASQ